MDRRLWRERRKWRCLPGIDRAGMNENDHDDSDDWARDVQ